MQRGFQDPRRLQEGSNKRPYKYHDFSQEYIGRRINVVLALENGKSLSGLAVEASKYFIKLRTDQNRYVYINKAWIATIEPQ